MDATPSSAGTPARRHRTVALAALVFAGTMFGAAYAAVPLYDWFCRVTGLGGTTQVATAGPVEVLDRTIEIRFDSNVRGLPWTFTPPRPVTARIGEVVTVTYTVENTSAEPTAGTATYNVVPLLTGGWFNKLQCFCFTEQTLAPGEKLEMPVVFFVDPAIVDDFQGASVSTITLSYTFYPVAKPTKPVADRPATAPPNG